MTSRIDHSAKSVSFLKRCWLNGVSPHIIEMVLKDKMDYLTINIWNGGAIFMLACYMHIPRWTGQYGMKALKALYSSSHLVDDVIPTLLNECSVKATAQRLIIGLVTSLSQDNMHPAYVRRFSPELLITRWTISVAK
ncbi:hypothetical protein Plhal304r1_c031g0100751 [Plasmopara halstedii]